MELFLCHLLEQILLPVESLDLERVQIRLHHVRAVCLTEVDLPDALKDQVAADPLEAHDRVDQSVPRCIVSARVLVAVDRVRHGRSVHKDAAVSPEDGALDKALTFLVAWDHLIRELLHNDKVLINYRRNEAKVIDLTVPLFTLILRQDRLQEVIDAAGPIDETVPLKDSWLPFTKTANSFTVDDLDVSITIRVHSELLELSLVEFDHAASCHLKVRFDFVFVFVCKRAVLIVAKIVPVLNTTNLMV